MEKTGLGRTWIGVILMASATSLPELFTGISSVAIFNSPDIAAGDVLGSCMFNLLILAILDMGLRVAPISTLAHQGQILTASFGILLLGLTTISLLAGRTIPTLGWIGLYSLVIPLVYLAAVRLVFSYEKRRIAEFLSEVKEVARYDHISKAAAYRGFVFYAAIIVVAATYLPYVADQIAVITGLGRTFVGSILVALSTSLPEIVVGKAALKMGAVDLAVGNVLGSNLFNLLILAVDDVFFPQGPASEFSLRQSRRDGMRRHGHDGHHDHRPDVSLQEENPVLFVGLARGLFHLCAGGRNPFPEALTDRS